MVSPPKVPSGGWGMIHSALPADWKICLARAFLSIRIEECGLGGGNCLGRVVAVIAVCNAGHGQVFRTSFRVTGTIEGVNHEASPVLSVLTGTRLAVEYPPSTPLVARACVCNRSAIVNPAWPVAGNLARLITGPDDQFSPTDFPLTIGRKVSTSHPQLVCGRVCRFWTSCHTRGLCPLDATHP